LTNPAADLPPPAREALAVLVEQLGADPRAPSSVLDPADAWNVHVADSLSALAIPALAEATAIADIGSGAGFPGAVLAAALPEARVDLIESSSRKCAYMRDALAAAGIANARVVCARAEDWARESPPAGGREAYTAVTARAVGRLATLAELASPLLAAGGVLVAWKGRPDATDRDLLLSASPDLAMTPEEVRATSPYPDSRHRHLHVLRKAGPTPDGLPRRTGLAAKRPFGS
jgi:16S rRNA (guanine527-N7)-methyltransferase